MVKRIKIRYITQPSTRPPTFVAFCQRADALPKSYVKYLTNSLREAFDLPGVPVRFIRCAKARTRSPRNDARVRRAARSEPIGHGGKGRRWRRMSAIISVDLAHRNLVLM